MKLFAMMVVILAAMIAAVVPLKFILIAFGVVLVAVLVAFVCLEVHEKRMIKNFDMERWERE